MLSKRFVIYITTFIVALAVPVSAHAATFYVATNGSDSNNGQTTTTPFATINRAQSSVQPGDTVLVRGGTYKTAVNLTKGSGQAGAYVTYKSYPGETAVIDGASLQQTQGQSLFAVNNLKYVIVEGFEVMNTAYTDSAGKYIGGGRGINVYSNSTAAFSDNVIIRNNKVHNTYDKGIGAAGTNITVEGNEVYQAAKKNFQSAALTSGWPTAISTYFMMDSSGKNVESRNINILNNYVHESWGEGIDAIALDGARIAGNRVRDTFSVLIYTDNARNITIDGNYLTATDPYYFLGGLPARGIQISGENCCIPSGGPYEHENIIISNNLIVSVKSGVRYWVGHTKKPYRNLKIFNNTIKDSIQDPAINLDSTTTSGNELRNNIIYGGATMPDAAAWSFSHNNWVNSIPSLDTSPTSFSSDPLFINPIVGGPADGYKLQPTSSSIGKGLTVSAVSTDYFGKVRPSNPTVGFYEYASGESVPSPTPKPWTTLEGDYSTWSTNYLKSLSSFTSGDFSENGVVDGVDYVLWLINYAN